MSRVAGSELRRGQHTLNPNATDAKADSGDARISVCVEKSQDDFLERIKALRRSPCEPSRELVFAWSGLVLVEDTPRSWSWE